ncbi:hypothetical protein BC831DRAFT_195069 [Entophlyctis helioformis]|nr:hypothetical protein BC831DRAFT_195069 [Entophlyctis helioformis]
MSRCKVISLLSKAREDLAAAQPPPSQSSAAASIHSFVPGIARILSRPLSPLFQARSMSSTWSSPSSPSASASTTGSMIPSPSSSSRVGLASLASLSNAPALGPSGTSVGLAGALTTSRPPPAQQALQSATASPLRAAPSVTTALALKTQQLDPSTEFGLDTEIAALDIPPHLQSMLLRAERCSACGSVCFESAIRMYEVIGAKTSSIKKLCSLACAQRDEKFAQRCTFWYSPQDDL